MGELGVIMPDESVKLFISYCHRDEILRQQLDKHLAPLKGQKVVEAWHDRQIRAGEEWANQIDANLNKADIILLLVSPDFVASDYCSKIELEQAVKRHEAGEAIVVPVILEPCDWSWLPFAKFQAFPKDGKAIATWGNQNEAFLDVAQGIRKVAQELFAKRQQKAAQKEAVKARYLQKVQEALSDETISDIERDTLDELREELGLTLGETAEIETHAYEPYRKYEEDRNKYRKTLIKLIDKGDYPFSDEIKRDLELRQRDLGLKDEDVARIEQPILAEAEAKYQERLQAEAAEHQRQLALEAETQRQRELEHQKAYESKLGDYQEEFCKAVRGIYPLSESAWNGLRAFQQSLELNAEDVEQIEQPILAAAETKYQEKLKAEAAERQRQLELEVEEQKQLELEQAEYEQKLQRYEQEFTRAIKAGYPIDSFVRDALNQFQRSLELSDEDVAQIEAPLVAPKEADHQQRLAEEQRRKEEVERQRELERQKELEQQRQKQLKEEAAAKQKQAEEKEKRQQKPAEVASEETRLPNIEHFIELKGHAGMFAGVGTVDVSPDGKTLASGSDDCTIKIWGLVTTQELRTLLGHSNCVRSVAFSPDGKRLASGSDDKTIKLWDWETGLEVFTLRHESAVTSIAFSRNGDLLASGSDDKTIKLWNWKTGQEMCILSGHSGYVQSVAFSPNGQSLASGEFDGKVKLWDCNTQKEILNLEAHLGSVNSVTFSPDGQTLLSSGRDGKVKLWNLSTGELRQTLSVQGDSFFGNGVMCVAISPDGNMIASASDENKNIKLWRFATGELIQTLSGHSKGVTSVVFSPDSQTLISGSNDKTVRIWF